MLWGAGFRLVFRESNFPPPFKCPRTIWQPIHKTRMQVALHQVRDIFFNALQCTTGSTRKHDKKSAPKRIDGQRAPLSLRWYSRQEQPSAHCVIQTAAHNKRAIHGAAEYGAGVAPKVSNSFSLATPQRLRPLSPQAGTIRRPSSANSAWLTSLPCISKVRWHCPLRRSQSFAVWSYDPDSSWRAIKCGKGSDKRIHYFTLYEQKSVQCTFIFCGRAYC